MRVMVSSKVDDGAKKTSNSELSDRVGHPPIKHMLGQAWYLRLLFKSYLDGYS